MHAGRGGGASTAAVRSASLAHEMPLGGKSTLLSILVGAQRAYRGKLSGNYNRAATLPQSPRAILSGKTVRDSLMEITRDPSPLSRVIKVCRLDDLLERHPFDLSGGETQRAALAKVLLT